jgi:hypothetical protein
MQGPRASKVAKVAHPASAAGISNPVAAASSSAPAAVKCTNRSHPSRSAAVTQRPHASLTARVEALRRIDNPSTTLSRLIVNLEAGNPHLAIPENRRELDVYLNAAASFDITANAALWAYETTQGFCHVWVDTTLSREIAVRTCEWQMHLVSMLGHVVSTQT